MIFSSLVSRLAFNRRDLGTRVGLSADSRVNLPRINSPGSFIEGITGLDFLVLAHSSHSLASHVGTG